MADRLEVDMIVSAITEGFDKMVGEFDKGNKAVKQAGEEAKSSGMKWTEMKSQIDLAAGAAGKFLEFGQDLFEFGRQGAMFEQTTQSFDGLIDKLDITTPLMADLREESNGTVDDMTLMSGALTLVAGASDDMARKLLEATPQLMRIAKASNKLNPSLGETAFLYESISTGIKRASPLILDNLGIVVKIGEANEKWAEANGKTVASMSAEDKTLALLNATMEAGNQLVEQAGGTTDSAVDSYDRLTTAWANLTNEIKADAAPVIGGIVDVMVQWITATDNITTALSGVEFNTENYREYQLAMIEAAEATGTMTAFAGDFARAEVDAGVEAVELAQNLYTLTEREWEVVAASKDLNIELEEQRTTASYATFEADALSTALDAEAESTRDLTADMKDLNAFISGPLGKEMDTFTEKQETLTEKMEETRAKIDELNAMEALTPEQQKELDNYQIEMNELSEKFDENADIHDEATKRILFNILQQQAAIDGFTEAEVEALVRIATNWGLADQATADYTKNAADYFAALNSTAVASGDIVQAEMLELLRLQGEVEKEITINYYVRTHGTPPGPRIPDPGPPPPEPREPPIKDPPPDNDGDGYVPFASGTRGFTVPAGFPRDSYRIGLTSGERFSVLPKGKSSGGRGDTYIYNIYPTYSKFSNETALNQDIKLLDMMHNR